ncbi:filamentous hemagglutinin N-terminal domain-containing protein [filamentous cyanobacterium LEGE 11480]|uniref:Filamentous hemagglutinin N-terminal domain-containing protein n=1 Tax=Romeriopsis navalis LEGE 11480 TaxID=2777977 RepID=A0A928VME3_9CYAN|nr:filamentous hemagglutinin N-terminal domain-containing protein [Romeriopsis navalis]MBE9031221.1 filamentous hemagglutinin N-terminal domain-containing protein [Romeriopsis navalis LEGE 11480]
MKLLIASILGILLLPEIGWSQSVIVPDDTLGAERSQVTPNFLGLPVEAIDGGAQRDQNLFHSFREFNVDNGRGAYFAIPNPAIRNVLTRVTGGNPSEILGTIGTFLPTILTTRVPNVNLFLINPNGIVFGETASLDVGASFFATTASGVRWGEGIFSATQPERPADLLTVNPSVFLFGSATPESIEVRSQFLGVPNGEALLLLGGDILIDGGRLNAYGGRVEVGAVGGTGEVKLLESSRLNIPTTLPRADISFTNTARVDVSLDQGGDISFTARNIGLSNSIVRAGIESGLGVEGNRAGDIRLDATSAVRLEQDSQIANVVFQDAIGNGGNLIIKANSLVVNTGAQLSSSTFGTGNAGNVLITASDQVVFQGSSADGQFSSAVFSSVGPGGEGDGGNVEITTSVLEVLDSAQLIARTSGTGDAGNVLINASNRVLLNSFSPTTGRSSGIFISNANTSGIGTGKAGTLNLTTTQLTLSNGAVIGASTANDKRGGDVALNLAQLSLLDGGQILTTSNSSGTAGDITLTASNQVLISGTDSTYRDRFAQFGTAVASINANSGLYARASSLTGTAGNITLSTPRLTLAQQGRIDTQSATGDGGNINLNVPRLLLLRNNSQISATAGTNAFTGDSGNIDLNARFIIAIPNENSDITANAFTSNGGNINIINVKGLLGFNFPACPTPQSGITASSDRGITGTIFLTTPDTKSSN